MKKIFAALLALAVVCLPAFGQPGILRNPLTTNNTPAALLIVTNIAQGFAGGASSNAWGINGNTIASSNWFGTSNNVAISIRQNQEQVGYIHRPAGTSWTPSFTMGVHNTNAGSPGAVIFGDSNSILGFSHNSVIAGGYSNIISGGVSNSFFWYLQGNNVIGGGVSNLIEVTYGGGFAGGVTISGGKGNKVYDVADDGGTIAGGYFNVISNTTASVISGGTGNYISNSANYAVIAGGQNNTVVGSWGFISGGLENIAGDNSTWVGGTRAQATNAGSFVWADSTGATNFNSQVNNSFLVKASGGVGINTNNAGTNALNVSGNINTASLSIAGTPVTAIGYALAFIQPTFSPADGGTYLSGTGFTVSDYDSVKIEVPKAGVIRRVSVRYAIPVTTGTSETVSHYIRLNNTTDISQIDLTYDANTGFGNNTAVATSVAAGDFLALKIVAPTWVANPLNVYVHCVVYIQ